MRCEKSPFLKQKLKSYFKQITQEYNLDDIQLQSLEDKGEGESEDWNRSVVPYKNYFDTLPESCSLQYAIGYPRATH